MYCLYVHVTSVKICGNKILYIQFFISISSPWPRIHVLIAIIWIISLPPYRLEIYQKLVDTKDDIDDTTVDGNNVLVTSTEANRVLHQAEKIHESVETEFLDTVKGFKTQIERRKDVDAEYIAPRKRTREISVQTKQSIPIRKTATASSSGPRRFSLSALVKDLQQASGQSTEAPQKEVSRPVLTATGGKGEFVSSASSPNLLEMATIAEHEEQKQKEPMQQKAEDIKENEKDQTNQASAASAASAASEPKSQSAFGWIVQMLQGKQPQRMEVATQTDAESIGSAEPPSIETSTQTSTASQDRAVQTGDFWGEMDDESDSDDEGDQEVVGTGAKKRPFLADTRSFIASSFSGGSPAKNDHSKDSKEKDNKNRLESSEPLNQAIANKPSSPTTNDGIFSQLLGTAKSRIEEGYQSARNILTTDTSPATAATDIQIADDVRLVTPSPTPTELWYEQNVTDGGSWWKPIRAADDDEEEEEEEEKEETVTNDEEEQEQEDTATNDDDEEEEEKKKEKADKTATNDDDEEKEKEKEDKTATNDDDEEKENEKEDKTATNDDDEEKEETATNDKEKKETATNDDDEKEEKKKKEEEDKTATNDGDEEKEETATNDEEKEKGETATNDEEEEKEETATNDEDLKEDEVNSQEVPAAVNH